MYQGHNRTALSSQKNIGESFIELLRQKEYCKISICEICQNADISRQTFYTLFESKENIVAFILAKQYDLQPEKDLGCHGAPTLEQLSQGYSKYILEKQEIIELLAKNNIHYMLWWYLYDTFSKCKDQYYADDPVISGMTADFIAAGLTTIAKHYCLNRDKISADQLQTLIYDLFSGSYFPDK